MSPSPASSRGRAARAALAALAWALLPVTARAAVQLDVGGAVEAAPDGLMVRLDVTNRGDAAATRVDVEGELFGYHAEAALPAGVPAAATQRLWLHFPVEPPRPGVHALSLHLRYPVPGAADPASQRAYLLLALGARAESPLRVAATPATFETAGPLRVELTATDGGAHAVRLRVLAPRGVNVLEDPKVTVPAQGTAAVDVPLIRTGPSRAATYELILLAATDAAGVETTAVGRATVRLVPHAALLPRLRIPLAVAGALLLSAAAAAEMWSRWKG